MVAYGLTVGDIIKIKGSDVVTTTPESTIEATAQLLTDKRIGLVAVRESSGQCVGVLSERDIVRAVAEYGAQAAAMRVADFMTRKVVVCGPRDHPNTVVNSMKERRIRHMPVVENGKLMGLVSIGDLLKHLLEHDELEHEDKILEKLRM